jgi:hypothetical protein
MTDVELWMLKFSDDGSNSQLLSVYCSNMHAIVTDILLMFDKYCKKMDQGLFDKWVLVFYNCRRFETGGVPKPTSECAACPSPDGSSAWASAKGGEARWPETGVREVEIPRPSCSSRAQVGCACSRGVTSVHAGEGSERPQESVCPVLGPVRPTFSEKALVLPFIGVRRGSRCTMGV